MARRKNLVYQERFDFFVDNASLSATLAAKLFTADRPFRLDAVEHVNPTGLATDAANYYTLSVKKGATIMASWSTLTGSEGALPANTFAAFTMSATAANQTGVKADVVSMNFVLTGTQTLPVGKTHIRGRWV